MIVTINRCSNRFVGLWIFPSLLHHKLHPAWCLAHVDCGVRVEDKATFSLLLIEVERHAPVTWLAVARSRTFNLRRHSLNELRAAAAFSETVFGQSNRNLDGFKRSGLRTRSWLWPGLTHGMKPLSAFNIAQSVLVLKHAVLLRFGRLFPVPDQLRRRRIFGSIAPPPSASVAPSFLQKIRHSDPVVFRHPGDDSSGELQKVAALYELSSDWRAKGLCIAPRHFFVRKMHTDTADVLERCRTDERLADRQLDTEGEKADGNAHVGIVLRTSEVKVGWNLTEVCCGPIGFLCLDFFLPAVLNANQRLFSASTPALHLGPKPNARHMSLPIP